MSVAEAAVEDAARIGTLKMVGFTGGEPFLYPRELSKLVAKANYHGLRTRVVTSATWSRNQAKTHQILSSMKQSGLDEISLSYDDAHAEYIPESNILNCIKYSIEFGVQLAINICVDVNSKITAKYVKNLLKTHNFDVTKIRFQETLINSTGRAEQLESDRSIDGRRVVGPCDHVLRGPTVNPSGKILPCCGTIPYYAGLSIGEVSETENICDALENAYSDPLMNWIAFEGPASILEQVTKGMPDQQFASDFDGNCSACDALFKNPIVLERAINMARGEKFQSLELQKFIYGSAGTYKTPSEWLIGEDYE